MQQFKHAVGILSLATKGREINCIPYMQRIQGLKQTLYRCCHTHSFEGAKTIRADAVFTAADIRTCVLPRRQNF